MPLPSQYSYPSTLRPASLARGPFASGDAPVYWPVHSAHDSSAEARHGSRLRRQVSDPPASQTTRGCNDLPGIHTLRDSTPPESASSLQAPEYPGIRYALPDLLLQLPTPAGNGVSSARSATDQTDPGCRASRTRSHLLSPRRAPARRSAHSVRLVLPP